MHDNGDSKSEVDFDHRLPDPAHAVAGKPDLSRRITLAVVVFALALAAIFGYRFITGRMHDSALANDTKTASNTPPGVDVVKVVRADVLSIVQLPGTASPFYETTIFARTSGYLKAWKHDIGDRVKAGELLAEIETPELDDQLLAAQAKVLELQAEVKLAQAGEAFAKVTANRWNQSAPDGVVSQQEKDEKSSNLESAIAHVDAARASVALGNAEVHRLETLEGFKRVVAPFDGVITQRQVDIGDLVTAGSTASTTPLFHIAQYSQLRVFVEIPQGISGEIRDGMPVTATAPENPTKPFHGHVDRTAGAIDPMGRMLRVEALVDNADLLLLPGTYLQVEFSSRRSNPPMQIPAAALTMRPEGPQAAVVSEGGIVTFHPIHIAKDLGDVLEVDQGLADGDSVALNVGEDIVDGSRITPNKTAATARPASPVALR